MLFPTSFSHGSGSILIISLTLNKSDLDFILFFFSILKSCLLQSLTVLVTSLLSLSTLPWLIPIYQCFLCCLHHNWFKEGPINWRSAIFFWWKWNRWRLNMNMILMQNYSKMCWQKRIVLNINDCIFYWSMNIYYSRAAMIS